MEGYQKDNEIRSLKVELEEHVCQGSYDDLMFTLSQVDGVLDLDIDKKKRMAFIDYDPDKVSEEQIITKVAAVGCRIQEF